MANNQEVLKDINIVTSLSAKYDMKNPVVTAKVLEYLREKNLFETPVGIHYLNRLTVIKDGTTDQLCFICRNNQSYDGIICEACMSKYSHGKKQFYGIKKDCSSVSDGHVVKGVNNLATNSTNKDNIGQKTKKYCKYCGELIDSLSIFCKKCGKRQDIEQPDHGDRNNVSSRNMFWTKRIIVLVIILLCALATASFIVFYNATAVKVSTNIIEAGSIVNYQDLIIPKSNYATVQIHGYIDTALLGDYKVDCEVTNGIFHAKKQFVFSVIDTQEPVIVGPEKIKIPSGKTFDASEYYKVEDFESGLEQSIVTNPTVDSNTLGTSYVVLSVSDSSGNIGKQYISVDVTKLSIEEEKALIAINQFVADGNSRSEVNSYVYVYKTGEIGTNGVDYYVLITDSRLYALYYDGSVREFTFLDAQEIYVYDLLVYAVKKEGKKVTTSSIISL